MYTTFRELTLFCLQVTGCHDTDTFIVIFIVVGDGDNGWGRTRDILNAGLVRLPLDHWGGPKMVVVITPLVTHPIFLFHSRGSHMKLMSMLG
jgi:hypothetical protein